MGNTAIKKKRYTTSAYIAHTLGQLSSKGAIAYHQGAGTGRWSYNTDISYWSTLPPGTGVNAHLGSTSSGIWRWRRSPSTTPRCSIAFLIVAAGLVYRFIRSGGLEMLAMMGGGPDL